MKRETKETDGQEPVAKNTQLTDDQRKKLDVFVSRLLTLHDYEVCFVERRGSSPYDRSFAWVYQSDKIPATVVNSGWFGKFIRQFQIAVRPWKATDDDGNTWRFMGAELSVNYDHGNLGGSGSNGVRTDICWDNVAEDWVHLTREELIRLQRKM